MFWVISSDGISWEKLACAKEKSTVLKALCFQFAATCFKLATYLLRSGAGHGARWGSLCTGSRARERVTGRAREKQVSVIAIHRCHRDTTRFLFRLSERMHRSRTASTNYTISPDYIVTHGSLFFHTQSFTAACFIFTLRGKLTQWLTRLFQGISGSIGLHSESGLTLAEYEKLRPGFCHKREVLQAHYWTFLLLETRFICSEAR